MNFLAQHLKRPYLLGFTLLASIAIVACGDGTSSTGTSSAATPSTGSNTSTAGVVCNYSDSSFNSSTSVNATSTSAWTCSSTSRVLAANGLPDHAVGTFPNSANPNAIKATTVAATYTLTPSLGTASIELGGPRGTTGFMLNGVKIDAGTGGSCTDAGICSAIGANGGWSLEAVNSGFDFGVDSNNAHVQPDGVYHYHGMPEGFVTKRGGSASKMTLIGWAADGFPIYARYGYTVATDASSAIKVIKGSFQLVTNVSANRPFTTTYKLGTFRQDWEYKAGSGDLDECNGRTGVTPEFPNGIYHYYATDSYPYLQRCVKGNVAAG